MNKMWTKSLLISVIVLSLLLSLSASAFATGRAVTPPNLEKVVLVHYAGPDGNAGKGPPPGKGPGGGGGGGGDKDNDHYELLGPKWASTVAYTIDPDFAPEGAVAEIEAAFEAWNAATSTELFGPAVEDSSASASTTFPDYINTVTFRVLAGLPRALAVTVIWYDDVDDNGTMTAGDLMLDTDIIFNLKFKWAVDPDGEESLKADAKGKYYDVRNIATHEAGHVVGLDDLYDEAYSELTMYGSASAKETRKISLETGDVLGTQELYGGGGP